MPHAKSEIINLQSQSHSGADRDRTDYLITASDALSQVSYSPDFTLVVSLENRLKGARLHNRFDKNYTHRITNRQKQQKLGAKKQSLDYSI